MTKQNCPECDNHCPVDALKCGKGKQYFGLPREERDISGMGQEDRILVLLRKCGHYLHHNVGRDADAAALTGGLSVEEKTTLEALLQKCLERWQK